MLDDDVRGIHSNTGRFFDISTTWLFTGAKILLRVWLLIIIRQLLTSLLVPEELEMKSSVQVRFLVFLLM